MLDKEISEGCKRLKLSQNLAEKAQTITGENHQEYLLKLIESEIEYRQAARIDKLINKAGFYTIKTFQGFRFDEINLPNDVTPEYLKGLGFLKTKTNIVMYGNVGTGKTYLSTALGVEACKAGIETRFFRTAALVNRLSEAKRDGTLTIFMTRLLKAELIILDEWGYVPLDITGSQLLFEIISECYERKTLIINTNIEFSRWINVFYDKDMTAAILDRMLHHCHLLLFPGDSNRMRESGISN
ncbi:MAG: ATP-binding protein [Lentisphaerae bacterium]|nr:ATP-binding protein [Lentisphaerota bacterium]